MTTCASALFLNFGEVGTLIPVGFRVVVVGDGVKAGGFGGTPGDDGVGHADDGGGIHAAAEFGEDGAVGAEPAPHGFGESDAEMFFVLAIRAITDSLARIKIPILADDMFSRPYEHR